MKTWVAAFIRFLCLVHASYCMKGSSTEADSREDLKNEDSVTTEAAEPNHKAVQPGETYIIIILAVFVGILFLALVGACIIIFLQRRWIQRHTNPLELPADPAINTGEDNVAFEIEDVEEDSGHDIPPQPGEDNPSITEDEAGPTGRIGRPRVHFARCPDDEQSTVDIINQPDVDNISHNELNHVDGYGVSTVAPHGCLANVVGEDDTDETNENAANSEALACDSKPTDMNPYNGYQNIDPDGRLIPIVESEDSEAEVEDNPYDNVTFTHNSDVRFSSSSSENDNVTFTHNSRQFSNSSNGNDNVTIPNSGVQLSSSSSDTDDYIHMFTVQRTRDDPPLPVSSLMTGSQSDIFTENSILPHHGLEEDRPQSGKSSSGNSSN